jgi:hypothetical protein
MRSNEGGSIEIEVVKSEGRFLFYYYVMGHYLVLVFSQLYY